MNIKIKSNAPSVRAALGAQCERALEMCGLIAEGHGKENCTDKGIVDTGNLRNSITYEVQMDSMAMAVGTDVEYAIYNELGTGIYADGGRQTPWAFEDINGKWHWTRGMKARPFIKPAISQHKDEYKKIIEDNLKK